MPLRKLIHGYEGTAGYGTNAWAVGESFADRPVFLPAIYDPSAPSGGRWSRDDINPSTVPRMYHSSAVLLPDGMLFMVSSVKATEKCQDRSLYLDPIPMQTIMWDKELNTQLNTEQSDSIHLTTTKEGRSRLESLHSYRMVVPHLTLPSTRMISLEMCRI